MSVIERARQVQGLAGRRVRRARPSESRAGTVVPLSVRTLTGGDVGIGRDVRPSYVQVGAGARMYGFTPRGGRALPSIRALDNMDTPLSRTVGESVRAWRLVDLHELRDTLERVACGELAQAPPLGDGRRGD